MSLKIHVDSHSGYRANDRPTQLQIDGEQLRITEIETRWYEPKAEYFKVRTSDGRQFLLRYSPLDDKWTLE